MEGKGRRKELRVRGAETRSERKRWRREGRMSSRVYKEGDRGGVVGSDWRGLKQRSEKAKEQGLKETDEV